MATVDCKKDFEPTVEPIVVAVEPVVVTEQNASSEGLARMYADLEPMARRLRSAAASLLCISLLFCGSIEGLFGLIAAASVLCCAAPGSLGTAYAARCTRICAVVCAAFALGHLMVLSTVAVVAPQIPDSVGRYCNEYAVEALPKENVVAADTDAVVVPEQTSTYALAIPTSRAEGAETVVFFAAKAARKLQAVAPESMPDMSMEQCEHAAEMARRVLPYLVLLAALGELCLFAASMTVSRRAFELIRAARSYGANAL